MDMELNHIRYLRQAVEVSKRSRANGNTPFGALLVGPDGQVLMEQENEEITRHCATLHAEMALAARASEAYEKDFLWNCTLYTTVEPCPMCTGGIYWANIGRIVYGVTEKRLLEMTGDDEQNPTFDMGADKVVAAGQKPIQVEGPVREVEEEVVEVHRGFWKNS